MKPTHAKTAKWTQEKILLALKALKENKSIDFLGLPDLTPEERAVFESRTTMETLKKKLNKMGIYPEEKEDEGYAQSQSEEPAPS